MEPYAAFVIGAAAGALAWASVWTLRFLHVDDPVDAVTVHLLPGLWGTIAPGFFATPVRRGAGAGALFARRPAAPSTAWSTLRPIASLGPGPDVTPPSPRPRRSSCN